MFRSAFVCLANLQFMAVIRFHMFCYCAFYTFRFVRTSLAEKQNRTMVFMNVQLTPLSMPSIVKQLPVRVWITCGL